ncbi:transcriptional repressor LexA [Beggiatoa alba]|nr:transcriptional repressor LexA [Beggiatoa alba]
MILTQTEIKIRDFIRAFIAQQGHSPTLKEIGEGVAIKSKGTIHRYISALKSKGALQHTERQWRGLALCVSGSEADSATNTSLPFAGRIAAGQPIEAIVDKTEIDIHELLIGKNGRRYALEIKGDSMIDLGILDGDIVVIERRDYAKNGDIVVALIDEQNATLKRFHLESDGQILLIPANAVLTAQQYTADRVRIQGVLVGQMRTYPIS